MVQKKGAEIRSLLFIINYDYCLDTTKGCTATLPFAINTT